MELLLSLAALLALIWLIATPFLLFAHFKLRKRVDELASRIASIKTGSPRETKTPGPWSQPAAAQTAKTADVIATEVEQPAADIASDEVVEPSDEVETPPLGRPPVTPAPTRAPPRAYVFRQDKIDELAIWLKDRWVLAAGAVSLALAGIFLVQYGVEKGLLTPFWRVMAAFGFGLALLVGGEVLRRRFGDEDDNPFEFLPSALAGAGILTLFAGVLGARTLYGLIGPGPAFVGLFIVSLIAMVFGWFYGPLLTIVGIIGATAAPFLVGGRSDTSWLIQYYFVLIALTGLAADSLKRWAWVSVIVLIAALLGAWQLHLSTDDPQHFLAAVLMIAAAAIIIPERRLIPRHAGSALTDMYRRGHEDDVLYPEFPTRLAIGVTAFAAIQAFIVGNGHNIADGYLGLAAIAIIFIAKLVWMSKAPALFELPLLPAVALILVTAIQAEEHGALYQSFLFGLSREPETAPPAIVWHLVAVAAIASLLAFWRMTQRSSTGEQGFNTPIFWAFYASVLAPAMVLVLEFLWEPARASRHIRLGTCNARGRGDHDNAGRAHFSPDATRPSPALRFAFCHCCLDDDRSCAVPAPNQNGADPGTCANDPAYCVG